MPLSNLLVYVGIGTFIVILFMFPSFRRGLKTLLGGFLNLFIEDRAKTPEGAAAIYSQAIDEAREKYSQADNTFKKMTGRLDSAKKTLDETRKKIQNAETKARDAMARGDENTARVYAEQRQALLVQEEQYKNMVNQLEPAVAQAKEIFVQRDRELREIQKKKTIVVEQLKVNKEIAQAYDDLDDMKQDSSSKRLIGAIDEEIKSGNERVAGAKIVHESKLSTRIQKADESAGSYSVDDYLNSLRAKPETKASVNTSSENYKVK